MLAVVLILHKKIVIIPNSSKVLNLEIANDTKYFPYFENCLGALDKIYLSAHFPAIIAPLYQNGKRWFS